jgi:hypothetical protein
LPVVSRLGRPRVECPERNMTYPNTSAPASPIVFWHRALPPISAEVMGEHTVEATSGRVEGTIAHRNELWDRCYQELMEQARVRLEQEVGRFNGHYAHVLEEVIDTRHDDATGETWLRGRFTYVLYCRSHP